MRKTEPISVSRSLVTVLYPVLAAVITAYVLFTPPMPGVADQGDFQRIMDIAGLAETPDTMADPELRFFRYAKTEYIMQPVNLLRFFLLIPSSSLLYPITLAKAICKIAGIAYFDTTVLAIIHSAAYTAAAWMCLKRLGISRTPALIFITIISIIILFDGNYLIWFNSLYGEPVMIIGLLLFIASVLYAEHAKETGFMPVLAIILSSFLFLGSKAQCITALPFVIFMLVRTLTLGKKMPFSAKSIRITLPVVLLLLYSFGFYFQQNKTCGVDTKYNSVFYGILKNSDNPKRDLQLLGLSEELAIEAGKHAYLPHDEYAKYVPWSEITELEFNRKITNSKLILFYLQNPQRFITGMEYTASQSFQTGTFLGIYKKADVNMYSYDFKRFTFWSDFRGMLLPKKLWFIILFYLTVIIVSAIEYMKRRKDTAFCLRIELIWMISAIGAFQFPMPYVGNGEADTAKQLFLFNFTFDILIIVACAWIFNRLAAAMKYLSRSSD